MKLLLTILLLLSIATACCNCQSEKPIVVKAEAKVSLSKKGSYTQKEKNTKSIKDYVSDTTDYFWSAVHPESGNYWVRLVFQKDFVVYQFHGQCIYWFFSHNIYTREDKISMLWSYKTDCVLSMDFMKRSNGVKHYPKFGDVFCDYRLVNDSTVEAKYYFPEWVDKVNRMEKDSIFPKFFYFDGSNEHF